MYFPHKLLRNIDFVILDLETTSTNPKTCRIIEVAAKVVDGTNKQWAAYHTYVKPGRVPVLGQYVRELTGADFTNSIWKTFPTAKAIRQELLNFIRDCILVVHSRNYYDAHVIRRVFRPWWTLHCIDSYYLARALYPRMNDGHSLTSVGYRLGINGGHRKRYHTALGDTEVTRLILHEFIQEFHVKTWGELESRVKVKAL